MAKKNLSRKAINLLRKVQKEITDDPRKFDMGTWGRMYDKTAPGYNKKVLGESFNSCGTVGCIAGWICVLGDKSIEKGLRKRAEEYTQSELLRLETEYSDFAKSLAKTAVGAVSIDGFMEDSNGPIGKDTPEYAAELLGLPFYDENGTSLSRLFHQSQWPEEFARKFRVATTQRKQAAIAVAVIDDFIENDGSWTDRAREEDDDDY